MSRRNKITFFIAEIVLMAVVIFSGHKIFAQDTPQYRVALIVPSSGQATWDVMINGMKDAASQNNIHMVICNTDEIPSASDQQAIIEEQYDNNIDAFIICPAPGEDTGDMLITTLSDKPYILMSEQPYSIDGTDYDIPVASSDSYEMGSAIAGHFIENVQNSRSLRVGIVAGNDKSYSSNELVSGTTDMLASAGITPLWTLYQADPSDVCNQIYWRSPVDVLIVLDANMLEILGENACDERLRGAVIYGMGNSKEAIALLDQRKIEAVVVPDSYDSGYKAVEEIAAKLSDEKYVMKNISSSYRIVDTTDIFTEELERYLYAYE